MCELLHLSFVVHSQTVMSTDELSGNQTGGLPDEAYIITYAFQIGLAVLHANLINQNWIVMVFLSCFALLLYPPVLVTLQSSFLLRVWYMMTTQTREVPTTQQTTAIITIPTVAHPSSSNDGVALAGESHVGLGMTERWILPLSVPRILDISQVYFPASAKSVSTKIRSWFPAAKKCLSVTTNGQSSFVQFTFGVGFPPAIHCRTVVSPFDTVRSTSGRRNDGVSE